MFALRLRAVIPALLLAAAAYAADEATVKPESILDKYIEVTGGRAAYEKVHTEIATGTMEISGMGLKGKLTSYRAEPNKSYTLIELEGVGKIEEGSDGQVVWAINPMEGARIKLGDERATALRNAAIQVELKWQDFYKKVDLAGTEDINGKPCYKLSLTPNEGAVETRYYDKASNLLVKVIVPVTTPNGPVTAEMGMSDYKEEDGILAPHTITQDAAGAQFVIKIDNVKRNPEMPAGRFDPPAEIKALLAADKAPKK
jgi:outer membrane lipoprotein-sorting protein